jgi:ABC-type antimicrobial peptide transport system permease subunit
VRIVVRRALTLAATGLAVGLVGAIAVSRVLESALFGVGGSFGPVALASLTLALTAAAASMLPARRAARINPMESLRNE